MRFSGHHVTLSDTNTAHLIVALALLAAYPAVTLSGMDGNPLLGVLVGQLGGRGLTGLTELRGKGGS